MAIARIWYFKNRPKAKKVSFKKVQKEVSKLKIPDIFLTDNIPNNAKYELEQFFEYIKKKYGL